MKRDTNEVTDEVNVRELRRNVSRDTLTYDASIEVCGPVLTLTDVG